MYEQGAAMRTDRAIGDVAKQNQIPMVMVDLNACTEGLAQVVERLEKRLSATLHNVPPSGDKPCNEVRAAMVPLAESIQTQADRVRLVNRRLDDILSRLEL